MKLSKNAKNILRKRYLRRDKNREIIETPAQLFKRVAKAVAEVEFKYGKNKSEVATLRKEFYKMMSNLIFLPNSPTLMNAGTNLGQLSACLSIDTELLTKHGWKNYNEYLDNDEVLTFNKDTNNLVFQTPIIKIIKNVDEMVHFKNTTLDILVTLDHDMLYRHGLNSSGKHTKNLLKTTAKQLMFNGSNSIAIPLSGNYIFPTIQKELLSNDECELIGWILSDGHLEKDVIGHKRRRIIIAQTYYCEKLERCLNACDLKWTKSIDKYRIHVESSIKYRNILDSNRRLNWDFIFNLTKSQLESLFYGFCLGDAQKRKNSYAITQEDEVRRNQIQVIAILLGKSAHLSINSRGQNIINVCESKKYAWFTPKKHCSIINKPQQAWCVQVPNQNIIIRRNGKIAIVGNCFVLPVGDDIDEIFNAVHSAARIHKTGGGTGFSFSRLRPKNDVVNSTGGIASGPLSFMEVFDCTTGVIKQGGKRRGANMGILRVDHPDIMDFITAKEKEGKLSNFNLSVAVTDKFIDAVKNDLDFDLINPRTGKITKTMKARTVWSLLTYMSWNNGEPAIIFIDTMNEYNPTPEVGKFEACNPCGETPLISYESCNLGSINLSKFFKKRGRKDKIDWGKLRKTVRLAVRFLDNIIDINKYPLPEIRDATLANRKIGLGVMGWADLLLKLGVRYDSNDGVKLGEKIMKFIKDEGFKMSLELGAEKGGFPNQNKSIYKDEKALRNSTITTIAPTGTIGIIAGCSHSIEPIFAIVQTRNVKKTLGVNLVEINPSVKTSLELKGLWNPEMEKALSNSQSKCLRLPKELREVLVTAHDVAPEWHVRMQAAFQKYTDNAVSKTVNLSFEHTVRDVEDIYLLAHELGCKGITVYRDGSRKHQLLVKGNGACPTCS